MSSNRRLDAEEALAWGLVSEVIPADELRRARGRARRDLGRAADARRRDDEAALRARPRPPRSRSSSRSRPSCSRRPSGRPTSPKESARSWRSGLRGSPAPERRRPSREGAPMSEQLPVLVTDAPAPHPIHLVVTDDLQRSRLTVFFRLLLVIPHFVWLAALGHRRLVRGPRRLVRRHLHGPRAGRAARLHRVVPALPDPRLRVLLDRGGPVPGVQRRRRLSDRRRDRAADEAEPAHDLLPAAARDPGLHRPLRARVRRPASSRSSPGSTRCSPASCTPGSATSSPTGSATTRRRSGTSAC